MINSQDLKSFIVTAKTLHLTKAAKLLGMSQPALSHCIKRLEIELGESLFLRRKDGLILTKAGEVLFHRGQKIHDDLESVTDLIKTGKEKNLQSLVIGMHPSVAAYSLPSLLKEQKDFSLSFKFGLSREVNQWIQEGKIDCGLVINPYAHPNLIMHPLLKDEFTFWISKKATNKDRLFINSELHQTQSLVRQLDKKDIFFKEIIEINNLELIAKLVYEGAGVGILPAKVVKNYHEHETKIFSPKIKSFIDNLCFVYSEENKKNENILKLKGLLSKVLV